MPRHGMTIDITKCNGCHNCFLACRDEYCGNDFLPYSASQPNSGHFWMRIIERERGKYPKVKVAYTAIPCMHCEEASCVKAAENGEIYRRADGIVIIDPEKSVGKKNLVTSCPYRVIYWNEEKQIPQKCTFCAHLLDKGWKEPRCAEACPAGALTFGDLDDPDSAASRGRRSGKTEVLHPEYGLSENVSYIGLPKRFIAGSVVLGDRDECGEGVKVTLQGKGEKKAVKTDNYGDFEFDGLSADKVYQLKIEKVGYKAYQAEVRTRVDVYLGDIVLSKAKTIVKPKPKTKTKKAKKK